MSTQCFTYATMFSIESLALAGESYANSESVKKACRFLLSKQMEDGGWGESYKVRLVLPPSFLPLFLVFGESVLMEYEDRRTYRVAKRSSTSTTPRAK